ncbi:MAG: beta strand repeat-containing protein, partial [Pirellulales bacterium]
GDAVTLGKDTVPSAATGPVTLAGPVGGLVSLAVTTSGATIFGGAVNLASLSTDGLGTTAIDGGAVTTTAVAGQVYGDAVTLGKETVLSAATGPVTLVRALSGSTALAVKTDGVTTFGGVVTLGSLETDAGGLTVINGGTSATGGLTVSTVLPAGQVYRDAVRLGRATALSAGNGPVTFGGTVSAVSIPIALDVRSAGVTTFGDTVDVARLVTDAPGMTVLGGAQATGKALVTRGGVSFGDPVVLAAPIVISASGGPVTFLSTVDGAFRLEVVTSANTTFRGAVGAGTPLAGLVTNAGGTSRIEGGLVRTSGALGQSYGDAVIVTRATSFKDEATGRLDFKDALSGRFAVEMAANRGSIEFAKGIGSGARLAGLSILAASAVNSAGAILLSGTAPGASRDGLQIGSGVSRVSMTVTGSLIEGFAGSGIRFVGGSADSSLGGFAIRANGTGVRVGSGDYGGTFVHSNAITGNTGSGVVLDATAGGVRALTVGGIEAAGAATGALRGNSIARNGLHGIEATRGSLAGSAVVANSIVGNGGSPAGGSGIAIAGDGLIVGWDVDAGDNRLGNRISGNASHGIDITGIDNSILSNAIHSNGGRAGQGVRLGANANGAAVTPQLVNVARDHSAGVVRIEVRVPGAPHTSPGTHLVQVFCNGAADEFNLFPVDTLAFEGRSHVGPVRSGQPLSRSRPTFVDGTPGVVAVTGEDGLVTIEVPASVVPVGSWLTATATRLAGGSPQGTSGFSRAFQVQNAPTLAIGGDGPGTTWDRELVYTVGPNGTLLADNLSAGVVSALTARRNGALLLADIAILLTEQGLPTITRRQVADIVARGEGVEITLAAPPEGENPGALVPGTTGTAMLADVSLPAARLYDASRLRGDANGGAVAPQALLLDVGADRILRALADATSRGETAVTAAERNAFVTRFQGGLRVASADFDGDGTAELVTAPGAVPGQLVEPFSAAGGQTKRPLSEAFGAASRVITIYNGRTDVGAKWSSVSIDMSSFFNEPPVPATKTQAAIPAKNYAGGFLVATGDLLGEGVNSGNGLAELVVVSTGHQRNRAFVFDVAVAAKGERPRISLAAAGVDGTRAPIPSRVIPLEAGRTVTGVAVAAFGAERDQERTIGRVFADIAIASTSAVSDQLSRTGGATALDTSTLRVYRGGNGGFVGGPAVNLVCPIEAGAPRTAVVNGVAVTTKVIQNAFLFGAGLASGDIDHDLRPDLVLGAQAGGLGTFRVIDNSVVRTLLQPTTTRADGEALLTRHLTATQPGADRYGVAGARPGRPDDNGGQWQPQGGTDFFLGKRVPTPIGAGFNAPLSVAVVERNGRSFSADVFAALGASNQAMEQVRWYECQAAGEWRAGDALLDTDGVATTNRFRPGRGLRLG